MRYGRFARHGRAFFAEIDDDVVHELDAAPWHAIRRLGKQHPLGDVEFLPPCLPGTFYAAGFNYAGHNASATGRVKLAEHPEPGYRANSALIGHGSAIVKPAEVAGRFEAEAEVVAVINRRLRHASRDEARDAVFGWTIGNDVSAREWQHADRTFYRAKNADTFKPMGPWIDTAADPVGATTTVSIDRVERARFATDAWIFDPYDFLVEISRYSTLHPGDVLWMGAEANVQLEPGETVDIHVTGIGTLSNPVVAGGPDARIPTTVHEGAHR